MMADLLKKRRLDQGINPSSCKILCYNQFPTEYVILIVEIDHLLTNMAFVGIINVCILINIADI